jgi:hypothetical protein
MDPVTPVSTPAPAQPSTPAPAPAAPQTQTASQAAIASGSTGDYRAARRAERAGKPLEAVPVAAVTPSTPETLETPEVSAVAPAQPETPERQLSRRQQEINERSQRAVESATLTLREENARLREQLAARQGPTTPEPAPAPQTPEWKKYRDMPDAPKLADFDSVEDHAAAMSLFVAKSYAAEQQQAQQERSTAEQLTAAQQQRVDTFVTQLHAARAADPEFVNKLSPTVRDHVKPFAALRPGEHSSPVNVIGELVYDSPIAPKVLLHLSANPDALKQLVTPPPHILALPPAARVQAHTQWMVRAFGKLEGSLETPATPAAPATPAPRLLTEAPAPPQTLGNRPAPTADAPKQAAIKSGDTRAYRRIRREERARALAR